MEGKIITIISETGKGFFESMMKTAMDEDGFKNYMVSYHDSAMEGYLDESDTYLIIISKNMIESGTFLHLIKKKCQEHDRKAFLYGTADDIFDAKNVLTESNVAEGFVRPLGNKEVVEKINNFFGMIYVKNRMKRILVVDDSGMMLRTILSWLEGTYSVSLANSAASAFKEIQKNKPDLILLDYEMPVCTGAQFMEMLKAEEDTKDIPVVFLTARDDKETVSEVLKLKPVGYLLKTTPEHSVLQFLENYFNSHGMN